MTAPDIATHIASYGPESRNSIGLMGLVGTEPRDPEETYFDHQQVLLGALTDADRASVLLQLIDDGKVDADDESIEEMLCEAVEKRIERTSFTPPTAAYKLARVLGALDRLIKACDESLDQSTALQGVKAEAYTVFAQCGGRHV